MKKKRGKLKQPRTSGVVFVSTLSSLLEIKVARWKFRA